MTAPSDVRACRVIATSRQALWQDPKRCAWWFLNWLVQLPAGKVISRPAGLRVLSFERAAPSGIWSLALRSSECRIVLVGMANRRIAGSRSNRLREGLVGVAGAFANQLGHRAVWSIAGRSES